MELNNVSDKALELLLEYGPKLLLAIIRLLAGLWLIKLFSKALRKSFHKKEIEPSLSRLLNLLLMKI